MYYFNSLQSIFFELFYIIYGILVTKISFFASLAKAPGPTRYTRYLFLCCDFLLNACGCTKNSTDSPKEKYYSMMLYSVYIAGETAQLPEFVPPIDL